MQFSDGTEYTKDCRDFDYTGVVCCDSCHEYEERDIVMIDGEPALICCSLRRFFYPNRDETSLIHKLSPEEKLLRAIFGEGEHPSREEPD